MKIDEFDYEIQNRFHIWRCKSHPFILITEIIKILIPFLIAFMGSISVSVLYSKLSENGTLNHNAIITILWIVFAFLMTITVLLLRGNPAYRQEKLLLFAQDNQHIVYYIDKIKNQYESMQRIRKASYSTGSIALLEYIIDGKQINKLLQDLEQSKVIEQKLQMNEMHTFGKRIKQVKCLKKGIWGYKIIALVENQNRFTKEVELMIPYLYPDVHTLITSLKKIKNSR